MVLEMRKQKEAFVIHAFIKIYQNYLLRFCNVALVSFIYSLKQ